MDRRMFLTRSALVGGGIAFTSPFHALGLRAAQGRAARVPGYGPLVPKGDLALPVEFNYQVISRQGKPMSDGQLTPGIFDGMGAFRGTRGRTVLIRNHENRELPGEMKVVTGRHEYDPTMFGGNTKLEVRRSPAGRDPITRRQLYAYTVVRDFAILGGTSTNCAGGVIGGSWVTCEEVVKRGAGGQKHGYAFEIPADARGPVQGVPIRAFGRFVHEALCVSDGIFYLTEDRRIQPDPRLGFIAGCFYRFIPKNFRPDDGDDDEDDDERGGRPSLRLAGIKGRLQALKIANEPHANMEAGRIVGMPYPVEWVDVPEPDHNDDTDNRTDRMPGFTPTRIQAQDRGAAYFEKMEGIWADGPGMDDDDDDDHDRGHGHGHGRDHDDGRRRKGGRKVFFVTSDGGAIDFGAVWEYDPQRETLTMIYESTDPARLDHPDNVVIVPQTGDIIVCEDGNDDVHFLRGVTRDGEIYDFCQTITNGTEFAGACFDPDGHTLYVSQQGERNAETDGPDGPPGLSAVTYAIYGPFQKRERDRHHR
jgi:uncharacterized protein